MKYDIPTRFLARLYLASPPPQAIASARTLSSFVEALGVDDMVPSPVAQLSQSTGTVSNGIALISKDNHWRIHAVPESIDVVFTPHFSKSLTLPEFTTRASQVLSLALTAGVPVETHRVPGWTP